MSGHSDDTVRALEAELASVRAQLAGLRRDGSNPQLERFAYIVSHDLQAPARMVAGFCTRLREECGERLDENGRRYVESASEAAIRLQGLIHEILLFSRLTARKKEFETVSLDEVVESVLDTLAHEGQIEAAEIEVASLPNVIGNRQELAQLFHSLLGNAGKFTQRSPLEVRVRGEENRGVCTIHVSDNGIGIPREFHAEIFEVFRRLHAPERYPGSGMGLTTCMCIVERHGGKIWIEESSDDGTTVAFTLPSSADET